MLIPFRDENIAERTPWVTYAIVFLNVAGLLWMARLSPLQRERVTFHRGFIPARIGQLEDPRPLVIRIPEVVVHPHLPIQVAVQKTVRLAPDRGEIVFSLFSAMFMHAGWLHLLGNMWFLWIFGNNIEDHLGHAVYGAFYLLCGLIATGCHWLMEPQSLVPVVGASGAVAGVLGAYAITFPRARVHTLLFFGLIVFVELPALAVLGGWFLIQLLEAREALNLGVNGGVAWWAHVGGFVAGAVLMNMLDLGSADEKPVSQDQDQSKVRS